MKGVVARAARTRERPEARCVSLKLLRGADHYDELIQRELSSARIAVWIATANLKDLRVEAPIGSRARASGRYISLVEMLAALAACGVEVRLLHGCAPSRAFGTSLAASRGREAGIMLRQCPRVHMKLMVIDGRLLYLGSANFTGAGFGAKGEGRRNFELGIVTDDDYLLDAAQAEFDEVWSGGRCAACRIRRLCPEPIDGLIGQVLPDARSPRSSAAPSSGRRGQ